MLCYLRLLYILSQLSFYARQHICYSAYMPRQFRLSVCHTRALCQNSSTHHQNFFIVRAIILVFRHQGSLLISYGFLHPQRGCQIQGDSNFRPVCGYISETVIDRGIVTMEDEYKVVCALSNSAAFDDLEWPRTPVSKSQSSLKANISQTVHTIHSMFRSRLGFSGSADRMALFPVR